MAEYFWKHILKLDLTKSGELENIVSELTKISTQSKIEREDQSKLQERATTLLNCLLRKYFQ